MSIVETYRREATEILKTEYPNNSSHVSRTVPVLIQTIMAIGSELIEKARNHRVEMKGKVIRLYEDKRVVSNKITNLMETIFKEVFGLGLAHRSEVEGGDIAFPSDSSYYLLNRMIVKNCASNQIVLSWEENNPFIYSQEPVDEMISKLMNKNQEVKVLVNHHERIVYSTGSRSFGSDITINVNGRSIWAHQLILSSHSEYFRKKIEGIYCGDPTIQIPCPFEIFESILQFIYFAKLPDDKSYSNIPSVCTLIDHARTYGISEVSKWAKGRLQTLLRNYNDPYCQENFKTALEHDLEEFLISCLENANQKPEKGILLIKSLKENDLEKIIGFAQTNSFTNLFPILLTRSAELLRTKKT